MNARVRIERQQRRCQYTYMRDTGKQLLLKTFPQFWITMNEVSRKDTGATRVNYDCTYYEEEH